MFHEIILCFAKWTRCLHFSANCLSHFLFAFVRPESVATDVLKNLCFYFYRIDSEKWNCQAKGYVYFNFLMGFAKFLSRTVAAFPIPMSKCPFTQILTGTKVLSFFFLNVKLVSSYIWIYISPALKEITCLWIASISFTQNM